MKVLIIANGEISPNQPVPSADLIIAADGGARHALALGITPQVALGDLDSLPERLRERLQQAGCEFIVHPRAKDATDLELAVEEARRRGASQIVVLGAIGSRPDQSLANFLFPSKSELAGISLEYGGAGWRAVLVRESIDLEGMPGDIVSLLPVTERVEGVSTEGLRYALREGALERGSTQGVSNEMLGERASIRLRRGLLWVIQLDGTRFREGDELKGGSPR